MAELSPWEKQLQKMDQEPQPAQPAAPAADDGLSPWERQLNKQTTEEAAPDTSTPWLSDAGDLLKSAGSGLAGAPEAVLGSVGDVDSLIAAARGWLAGKPVDRWTSMPTTRDVEEEFRTGKGGMWGTIASYVPGASALGSAAEYEPTSKVGKILQIGGQAAGAGAITGGIGGVIRGGGAALAGEAAPSILGSAGRAAAVQGGAGLGSSTAQSLPGVQGTAKELPAAIIGGVLGGGLGAVAPSLAGRSGLGAALRDPFGQRPTPAAPAPMSPTEAYAQRAWRLQGADPADADKAASLMAHPVSLGPKATPQQINDEILKWTAPAERGQVAARLDSLAAASKPAAAPAAKQPGLVSTLARPALGFGAAHVMRALGIPFLPRLAEIAAESEAWHSAGRALPRLAAPYLRSGISAAMHPTMATIPFRQPSPQSFFYQSQ